jgi:hypothetical protein
VFREVGTDEERHLRYCRAVGRRYSGSDEAFEREVGRLRLFEAEVYGAQSRGFVRHMMDRGMLELAAPWDLLLRTVIGIADRLRMGAPRLRGPILLGLAEA